jgi:hypothetical protein
MAAGSVVVYMNAVKFLSQQSYNWASNTMLVHLVSHGYVPSPQSHSAYDTDVSAYELTTTGYAARILQNQVVSQSSNSHIRFDADDITLSATATMTAKWAVLEMQATKDVLCYVSLENSTTSGIDATQIIVQWGASGVFEINSPA